MTTASFTDNPNVDTTYLVESITNAVTNSTTVTRKRKDLKLELTPWVNTNLQSIMEYKKDLLKKRRKVKNKI